MGVCVAGWPVVFGQRRGSIVIIIVLVIEIGLDFAADGGSHVGGVVVAVGSSAFGGSSMEEYAHDGTYQ